MSEPDSGKGIPGFALIPGGSERPLTSDDGRNIDLQTGLLSGEGSEQKPLASLEDIGLHSQIFPHVPSRQPGETPSYYGVPVLKEPVWIGTIAAYFYTGGVAGMSATLGSAVQLLGGSEMRSLVVKTRWIATIGALVSTGLLIEDLGRPERFLHMLRVFKVTSHEHGKLDSHRVLQCGGCSGGASLWPANLSPASWRVRNSCGIARIATGCVYGRAASPDRCAVVEEQAVVGIGVVLRHRSGGLVSWLCCG